jgi:hypothetical protein
VFYFWSPILGENGKYKAQRRGTVFLHAGMGESSSSSRRTSDFTHVFEARDAKALSELLASGHMRVNGDHCVVNVPQASSTEQQKCGLLYWACYHEWAEGIALLMRHGANPYLLDLTMDTWITPRDVLVQKLKAVSSAGAQTPSLEALYYYMLALLGGNHEKTTPFDVDAPFHKMPGSSAFKGTALMYAAQEGYVHGAQLLVDKYEADPILSLPSEHEQHVGKKRGRQPQLGVSAMDYALKALFAMVRSNPEEKEEEDAAQKQKKMEQLMATVEYLRTFDQAYIMDEDLEDVDEE